MMAGGVDSRAAAREKTRANKAKQRRRAETVTEAATFASMLGKGAPADAEYKSRRWNEKQKALERRRELLGIEFFERYIKRLDKEEAEERSEEEAVEDLGSSDSAEEQAEVPAEALPGLPRTVDAAMNSDLALLSHDQVQLAHECADVQEKQAMNRRLNADAGVVEQRAAKIEAEAKKADAEATKAEAEAASEPKRQKIKRVDEVVALVMRVVWTVYAMGIVLAGLLIDPLLIPSGAAVAGGAYGIKRWWSERKHRGEQGSSRT